MNEPKQDSAIAVAQNEIGALAGLSPQDTALYTTFDVETDEGRIATWNARAEEGIKIGAMIGAPIDIHNIVLYPATVVDTVSGEVKRFVRIAIVDPEGKTFVGGSEGILKDLASLQSLFGRAPYDPPLRVIPIQVNTSGGRRLFRLKVVGRVEKVNSTPVQSPDGTQSGKVQTGKRK